MRPLQSHGLYDDVWYPPHDGRFCAYERRDESWMRPLGLGTIKKVLRPLYDVRLTDGSLVGYTDMLPGSAQRTLALPVLPENAATWRTTARATPLAYQTVLVRCGRYVAAGEMFACWELESASDASLLIRTNWITCLGVDDIARFIYDLERKQYQRRLRYGSPLRATADHRY